MIGLSLAVFFNGTFGFFAAGNTVIQFFKYRLGCFPELMPPVEGTTLWAGYEEGGIEQNGDFDINMWDDGYPGIDPTDNQLWYFYHTDAGEPDYGWNIGRWSNEDFDAWLDEAYVLDEEYRQEVFCEIAQILEDELPEILLFSAFDASGVSARLQGVQATINDTHTWNVADWTVTE